MTPIRPTITKEEINDMPKVEFAGTIHVINTPEEAENAVAKLLAQPMVGIDTETRPTFKRGEMHQVALLQVATDNESFLFRLNKTGLTRPIIGLLESKTTQKIGLSLKDDFLLLHKRASFEPRNYTELQAFVREFGIEEMSLQKIYAILFEKKIAKRQQLSNWEAEALTEAQQQYASIDAWACLQIYHKLIAMQEK